MSADATSWVFYNAPTETPDQTLLAICLSEHAGQGDPIGEQFWGVSWPGWPRILNFCRMPDEDYARSILDQLVDLGVIRWDRTWYLLGEPEMAGRP